MFPRTLLGTGITLSNLRVQVLCVLLQLSVRELVSVSLFPDFVGFGSNDYDAAGNVATVS